MTGKLRLKLSSNKLDRTLVFVLTFNEGTTIQDNLVSITDYINQYNQTSDETLQENVTKIYLIENNDKTFIPLNNTIDDYLNANDHIYCEFESNASTSFNQQDLSNKRNKIESSNNNDQKMDLSNDNVDDSIVAQTEENVTESSIIEILYQTLPDARLGKPPKRLKVNSNWSLLQLKKQLAIELNENITTEIDHDNNEEAMDTDQISNVSRIRLEIPTGVINIEVNGDETLIFLKSIISEMFSGDNKINEHDIFCFLLNGVKLDYNETLKKLKRFKEVMVERSKYLLKGDGPVLQQLLIDASVKIDNSSLKHIINSLKSQTVADLKMLIGQKYLKSFVDPSLDWKNLIISYKGNTMDDNVQLASAGLSEHSLVTVSSPWFESIPVRTLLIVPDKLKSSIQFKEFEIVVNAKYSFALIKTIVAKVTNFRRDDFMLTARDVLFDDHIEVGDTKKLVLKTLSKRFSSKKNDAKSRVINISLAHYFLNSTPLTDHRSISDWGIKNRCEIYVLVYHDNYNNFDSDCNSSPFNVSDPMRSFTNNGIASDKHVSAFLSSLKVWVNYLRKDKYARYYVLSKLKYYLVDFPPVLLAMELLVRGIGTLPSFGCAAISQAIFIIGSELTQSSRMKLTSEQIGINTRFFLNFLLPPVVKDANYLNAADNVDDMELSFLTIEFGSNSCDVIDESALILASPSLTDEALVYIPLSGSNTMIIEDILLSPSLNFDWALIKTRSSPKNIFVLQSPADLKGVPPILTMNHLSQMVVYTQESCGNKTLWSPLTGDDENPSLRVPAGFSFDEKLEEQELDPCSEAIIVCIDVSNSMGKASDFSDDGVIDYDSDDENWSWSKSKDDTKQKSNEDMEKLFEKMSRKILSCYSKKLLKDLADKYTVELVMREICRLDSWENIYQSEAYRSFQIFYERFAEIIMRDSSLKTANDSTNDEVPLDFICPISRELIHDPVTAADGFTYERKNTTEWFSRTGPNFRSPLTGAKINKNLIDNNNLKSQISQWLNQPKTEPVQTGTLNSTESPDINLKIQIVGGPNINSLIVTVPSNCTVGQLKIAIIRTSSGKVNPWTLIFGAAYMNNSNDTLNKYRIVNNTAGIICKCSAVDVIDITLDKDFDKDFTISCLRSDTVSSILFRNWLYSRKSPSSTTLWYDLKSSGDGYFQGSICKDSDTIQDLLDKSSILRQEDMVSKNIHLTIFERQKEKKHKYSCRFLTRIQTVTQLFHALLNRTQAYSLNHNIGLVTFGSSAKYTCPITRFYDDFIRSLEETSVSGDTSLFDAVEMARLKLEEYCSNLQCKKRIIVLSDGDDTNSSIKVEQLTKLLINCDITVDSFLIGKTSKSSEIRACSIATGGYNFKPDTIRQALSLFEQEPILNLACREERLKANPSDKRFKVIFKNLLQKPFDTNDSIKIKKEVKMDLKVHEINEMPKNSIDSNQVRRISKEITALIKSPHPFIDIFPSEEDVTFWKVLITGPEGTPYHGCTFLVTVNFKNSFPLSSPEIRFMTPILHPNINFQGRVCHSIFDRNWSPDITVKTLLEVLFGLLLNPDRDDPLDSQLALNFYNDNGQYEGDVIRHLDEIRKQKNRDEWRISLIGE